MAALTSALDDGAKGMPTPEPLADAECAAEYVVSHVAKRAGTRLRQGVRATRLSSSPLGGALDLVATTRLHKVPDMVARALIAWAEGRRRVFLVRHVPAAEDVLSWQADGGRCVSLLPRGVRTTPDEDGLAFALHDLCHLEKFFDPEHHRGQVGFFRAVRAATCDEGWPSFAAPFDEVFTRELEHVVADMNGSAVFLFAALKMKLKMAVRRQVARERGRTGADVIVSGPLREDEELAFSDAEDTLLDLLGLRGHVRDAAIRVSTRRDDAGAAVTVLRHFEAIGSEPLARR